MEDPQDFCWWTKSCDKTTAQIQTTEFMNMEIKENSIQVKPPSSFSYKYNKNPRVPPGMVKMNMDYDQFLNKPLFVKSFDWAVGTLPGFLSTASTSIPGDIFTLNNFLAVPWKTSCFYRMKARAVIQTAGTIKHSGCMLVAAVPHSYNVVSINGLLGVPHGFLYPNQSNVINVEIPFYNESPLRQTNQPNKTPKLVGTNDDYDSYAALDFYILNQLAAGAAVSSVITVTVHVIIDELEFYVPCPMDIVYTQSVVTQLFDGAASLLKRGANDIIDTARGTLKQWTGLHNPNLGAPTSKHYMQQRTNPNVIDSVVPYDLLSPYASYPTALDDYMFKTDIDEMDMSYLLGIPQLITTVQVASTATRGTHLFSRPIFPFMGAVSNTNYVLDTIQSKLAYVASHWTGPMELIIQSSMSNVQFFKLLVVLDYSKNINASVLGANAVPPMDSFHGTITHTLEFNGGGSVQCVDLPYFSAYRQLPCTTDWLAAAVQHGVVRVYLLQPLVNGDSTAANPRLNFYYRCKPEFKLLGFSNRRLTTAVTTASPTLLSQEEELVEEQVLADELKPQSYSGEMSSVLTTTDQQCIQDPVAKADDEDNIGGLRPIKHLRDITRRLYPVSFQTLTAASITANGNRAVTLRRPITSILFPTGNVVTPVSMIMENFFGFRGGLRFKIMITGANLSSVVYVPPGLSARSITTFGTGPRYMPTSTGTSNVTINAYNNRAVLPYPSANLKQCPLQEQANFYKRPTNLHKNSGATYALADSLNIHDIEIPYMSYLDFVTNIQQHISPAVEFASYSDSLGELEISFTPTIVSPTGTDAVFSDVYITYFAGFADDARVGMLVPTSNYNPDFVAPPSVLRSQVDHIFPAYTGSSGIDLGVRLEIQNSNAIPSYTG